MRHLLIRLLGARCSRECCWPAVNIPSVWVEPITKSQFTVTTSPNTTLWTIRDNKFEECA